MISVIIPLYNKEKAIERTLRSVLSQDFDDYEIIIVDDGSTDKSVEIVENLLKHLKPLKPLKSVKLLSQSNGGPSKARNTGVKHAKGGWILFLDADDELLPGALKHFSDLIKEHEDNNFITCSYYVRTADGKCHPHIMKDGRVANIYKEFYYYKFHTRTGIAVYKKNLVLMNAFNERLYRFEDFDVWLRMFKTAKIYCSSVPVLIENQGYGEANRTRENIYVDFVGNMEFCSKTFWEKMCLYKLYLEERERYVGQIENVYPNLNKRYDLLLLHKALTFLKPIIA